MQNQGQVKSGASAGAFCGLPLTSPRFLQIITPNIRKAMTEESTSVKAAREMWSIG